jgi:hypothetical protein
MYYISKPALPYEGLNVCFWEHGNFSRPLICTVRIGPALGVYIYEKFEKLMRGILQFEFSSKVNVSIPEPDPYPCPTIAPI